MTKVTMIGCDLHDQWMLLKLAVDRGEPRMKSFPTFDVPEMIAWLQEMASRHGSQRIVFAYEASGAGFGLYDELTEAGIECHVLAPTHLPQNTHRAKNKTDEKDAEMILDELRAHVLAGRPLPSVWIPDPLTRDDRETVRMRLQVAGEKTRLKNQIRNLLKRTKLCLPGFFSKGSDWSRRSRQWLRDIAEGAIEGIGQGLRTCLGSLLDLYESVLDVMKHLDQQIRTLAKTQRYNKAFRRLTLMPGVGTLTAMVFLTELGDLDRFSNRRQLAAYLGLVPSAFESGNRNDRKGHITRQGPSRVRAVLCQAAWTALRFSERWRETFERIKRGSSKRSKIAIVAVMRQLAIEMWHTARSTQHDHLLELVDEQKKAIEATPWGSAPDPGILRLGANPEGEEGVALV